MPQQKKQKIIAIIGVFDGVHRGHQYLIKEALKLQNAEKLVLFTFNPHPDFILRKATPPYLITTLAEKKLLLKHLNLNKIIVLPFNSKIAALLPEEFLEKFLLKKFIIKNLVIGHDFKLGKKKLGDYLYLKKLGKQLNIKVKQVKPLKYKNKIISSSLIRNYLKKGNMKLVNYLLGYNYLVKGVVIAGEKRGQQIGFPTANLKISPDKLLPATGVYAGVAKLEGKLFKAVANLGYAPTFLGNKLTLEVHLLNFHKNIYGKNLTFYFQEKLRKEKKFLKVQDLQQQINKDIQKAKIILNKK